MKKIHTIILAAGKGTRMKSAIPKVLHAVCGKAILKYVLDVAKAVGSLKTCVVVGHLGDKVKATLPMDVATVTQEKLLGTADAVRCALPVLKGTEGDILILCGDTPLLRKETVRGLVRRHQKTGAECTFLTAVVENSFGYGRVIRDSAKQAVAIREHNDATSEEKNIREINVGVYCFRRSALESGIHEIEENAKKKEFYLTDIIALLAEKGGRVETYATPEPDEGLGVNSREDLAVAEAVLRQRILKRWMASGVTIIDPTTTFIYDNVRIGTDTIVQPFTVIENDVQIGVNCRIGPFAHLRPGTRIGKNVEVGNFAEVSRSRIGDNCFMKHFSFLGDAVVGREANIGAGVVTANFDGQNKNRTVIGDRAFIGSDSILVAPVTIGKDAMTGAGCVVTRGKKVPAGGIVVGVPAKLIGGKRVRS